MIRFGSLYEETPATPFLMEERGSDSVKAGNYR